MLKFFQMAKKALLIIAHAANSQEKLTKDLKWANLAEVDVAQPILGQNLIVQHNGLLGKLGIGQSLASMLKSSPGNKILFDLKHPLPITQFAKKFLHILQEANVQTCQVTSNNWRILAQLAAIAPCQTFYYLKSEKDKQRLFTLLPHMGHLTGVVIPAKNFSKSWLKKIAKHNLKIIVANCQNEAEVEHLANLGVYAVILNQPPISN